MRDVWRGVGQGAKMIFETEQPLMAPEWISLPTVRGFVAPAMGC